MGRQKGEVGESPALSRNCELQIAVSQVDLLSSNSTTSRKGGGIAKTLLLVDAHPTFPANRQGFLINSFESVTLGEAMTSKHHELKAFWFALALLILSACSGQAIDNNSTGQENLQYKDDLGREITLDEPAQRVVSLAPSNTEILFAIGAGNQVVGRDEFSDYPPRSSRSNQHRGEFWRFEHRGDYCP